jgi:hypothetical protein
MSTSPGAAQTSGDPAAIVRAAVQYRLAKLKDYRKTVLEAYEGLQLKPGEQSQLAREFSVSWGRMASLMRCHRASEPHLPQNVCVLDPGVLVLEVGRPTIMGDSATVSVTANRMVDGKLSAYLTMLGLARSGRGWIVRGIERIGAS